METTPFSEVGGGGVDVIYFAQSIRLVIKNDATVLWNSNYRQATKSVRDKTKRINRQVSKYGQEIHRYMDTNWRNCKRGRRLQSEAVFILAAVEC